VLDLASACATAAVSLTSIAGGRKCGLAVAHVANRIMTAREPLDGQQRNVHRVHLLENCCLLPTLAPSYFRAVPSSYQWCS